MIPLGVLEEIRSFIWIRRYWSCGEFKLLAPFTERYGALLVKNRIIMKNRGNEAGQIRYVDIRKNGQGLEEIEVQGRMLSWWLDKRIVRNQVVVTDNTQNIITRILTENVTEPNDTDRIIPALSITHVPDLGSGVIQYASEPYISSLLAIEDAVKAAKLGFKILTDVRAKTHSFVLYKGRELTSSQSINPPCIFSQEFDNILEQEYTNSTENRKSVAYVGGEEREGVLRQVVQVGTSIGLDRDEVFINATDITQTFKDEQGVEVTLTLQEYLELLAGRGASELEQHAETLNFTSKINTSSNLTYGVDFDLGDRVTCVNKRWGIQINVRITEIVETYQAGKHGIDITFGESLPTLIDQIRRMG